MGADSQESVNDPSTLTEEASGRVMARKQATVVDSLGRRQPTTHRGWGSVVVLPSGNIRASYLGPDGTRYAAPSTFGTRGDAEAWLAVVRDTIRRETWRPPHVLNAERFGRYASAWVDQRRTRKGDALRPRTREMYRDAIGRGMVSLADTRLPDLTPAAVRAWHVERTRCAGATQAGLEARILRAVLTTAVRDGIIASNPVPSELARTRTGRPHRPPTSAELTAILAAMPDRLRLAVQLAAFGGLRLSEWRALRRSDVTLAESGHYVVTVERQALRVDGAWIVADPKSDEGNRVVSLPAWLSVDVEAHLAEHVGQFPESLLFPSGGPGAYIDMAWRRAWDSARRTAGVTSIVREHDLRHYYATELAQQGATAPQLQAALGHSSIAMSMEYVRQAHGAPAAVADLVRPLPAAEINVVPIRQGA